MLVDPRDRSRLHRRESRNRSLQMTHSGKTKKKKKGSLSLALYDTHAPNLLSTASMIGARRSTRAGRKKEDVVFSPCGHRQMSKL